MNNQNVSKKYVDGAIAELKVLFLTKLYNEINNISETPPPNALLLNNLVDENIALDNRLQALEDEVNYFNYEAEHLHDRLYNLEIDLYESQKQVKNYVVLIHNFPTSYKVNCYNEWWTVLKRICRGISQ